MRVNVQFVISLFIILLVSWADIKFFGFGDEYHLSPIMRQAGHNTALAITALTGFLYFKKQESWIKAFWLVTYSLVFALVIVVSAIFALGSKLLTPEFKEIVAEIRLLAEGPVPFLVFYLLRRLVQSIGQ